MKLLLESWRKFVTEDWRDTSWETDDKKVTIGDVVDYLGDETVDVNVLELSQQLPELPTRGTERVAAASLDYPIIVVKSRGQYQSVLDGNHRLQKAIDEEVETIKAKILDLDNPETPEVFQRVFGGAEKSISIKDVHELADVTEELSCAQIKAICTEAGYFAIRANKKKVTSDNFFDAVDKIREKAEDEPDMTKMFG